MYDLLVEEDSIDLFIEKELVDATAKYLADADEKILVDATDEKLQTE